MRIEPDRATLLLTCSIMGDPQQQGSKRRGNRGQMYDANPGLPAWRDAAIWYLRQAMRAQWPIGSTPIQHAVIVEATFWFAHPKSHYRTGRNAHLLREAAPIEHATAPDLDKLQRALGDALTQAGVIHDDRLICTWIASKRYTRDAPHTSLTVHRP